jgi:electron transfer flavoprotein alpha subunit
MFEPLEPRELDVPIERIALGPLPQQRTQLVEQRSSPAWDLDEADIVVCVGSEVEKLPELPAEIALGGTREVCDRGMLPRSRQLGLLGRAVAPRLLITVGVAGDFEELTAFVKADVIAAINSDTSTPMLKGADVGLVGDWPDLLPSLLRLP